MSIFCHLFYVVISFTTIGMFFDNNRFASLVEAVRCIFLFFYTTYSNIPLLTETIVWSGHAELNGGSLHIHIELLLKIYFLFSAFAWTLLSHNEWRPGFTLKKTKCL